MTTDAPPAAPDDAGNRRLAMTGFDFEAAVTAPFRMQPGLRRLASGQPQLSDLSPDSPAFAAKLAVLDRHADQALLCAEGFDPLPALRALASQAAALGAQHLHGVGGPDGVGDGLAATAIGWWVDWNGRLAALEHGPVRPHAAAGRCLGALPAALRLAGLLSLALHEDLAIVDGRSARLPWMAVCLPSHWSPVEKIGRSFAEVHGPVADNRVLLAAAEHLSRLVCQPQAWERFVWNIAPAPDLDQHPQRHPRAPWAREAEAVIAQAHWRTEHQRFVPLPTLQQAIFTIHVAVQPLAQAIDSPTRATALQAALGSMSPAVLAYRSLLDARGPLLDWLAQRAASGPA